MPKYRRYGRLIYYRNIAFKEFKTNHHIAYFP